MAWHHHSEIVTSAQVPCFTAGGPYPTQENAVALSTAALWRAAGQFCFGQSSTPATLGTYFHFLRKFGLAAN